METELMSGGHQSLGVTTILVAGALLAAAGVFLAWLIVKRRQSQAVGVWVGFLAGTLFGIAWMTYLGPGLLGIFR